MLWKQLGRTGVEIPEIGLGTFDYHGGPGPLRRGIESGAFIDTAESYGTEPVVGAAIRGIRARVFLATKVSPEHFRAADFLKSVDASLRRLGTDVVDLLQLHHPNPQIPIEETAGALARLVDGGKVRFCGVSNFSVEELQQAQKVLGKHHIVSNQVRYNLIDRTIEGGLIQYCQSNGITVIAYSPLAKSLDRIADSDSSGVLEEISRRTGKTAGQIAINWCLCKNGVVAIPKANCESRVIENCGASDWRLTPEDVALLDARIQYRHRNRFDTLVRKYMPVPLQRIAVEAMKRLPRSLRRRIV
jgi:diketogulonate reductase-like aldo/keto reductase